MTSTSVSPRVKELHVIETATSEDFASIASVNVTAFEEFVPRLPPGLWEVMQKNLQNIGERSRSAEFMVCRSAERVIASVAYCPAGRGDPMIFRPDMASVLLLAVHPQHRGRGLAKALTAACISRACKDGAASVGLFTSELMIAAQHIYRSLGFQREAELPMRHGLRYFRFVLPLSSIL
jgi:ribosomal protein S18 acetylase RimI-like enzyme